MIRVDSIASLRAQVAEWRASGERIAFVPTMGNLHDGHISLVTEARKQARRVVSSIFVNPSQFGPDEDLDAYPRTLSEDADRLQAAGCDLLFTPSVEEMYGPTGKLATVVSVPALRGELCGASRPGHFDGVASVVARLFGLVQPDVAVFGKKDYQQWRLIEQLTADLGLPVEVVGCETVRHEDGLAMSSRNGYLTADERAVAPGLRETLLWAETQLDYHQAAPGRVEEEVCKRLNELGFTADYCSVRRASDLQPPEDADQQLVLLAAAHLGRARLIDNLEISR